MKRFTNLKFKNPLGLFFLFLILISNPAHAQHNELDIIFNWRAYRNADFSLYDYFADEAVSLMGNREKKIDSLQNLSDWKAYQKEIKTKLRIVLGEFPPKQPLNAISVRTIQKETYSAEHIIFESRPDFYVTSTLYLPKMANKSSKVPAILFCSGHTPYGYRSDSYQHQILNLVTKGFAVFAFDPIGQGERTQYYDEKTGKSILNLPTREHSYVGGQVALLGTTLANYMVWDGIRAIDYLVERPEIDASRLGITGSSGGGTQSSFIAAIDERIYASSPGLYLTSYKRLFQRQGSQDAEQNFFKGIAKGLDHADLLLARAPKPSLMVTTTNDMFSIQGARETASEVEKLYKAYGNPDNFTQIEDVSEHHMTPKNLEILYAFFRKHLQLPGNVDDTVPEKMSEEEMRVTSTGQLSTSIGGESVFSLTQKKGEKLRNELKERRKDEVNHLEKVKQLVKNFVPTPKASKNGAVFVGTILREGYSIDKYFIETPGSYPVPFLFYQPSTDSEKSVIALYPSGKSSGEKHLKQINTFLGEGYNVLVPDVVGIGELGPTTWGKKFVNKEYYRLWHGTTALKTNIVELRVADVDKLVTFLKKTKKTSSILGFAESQMSPVIIHAAARNQAIDGVFLDKPYLSYHAMITQKFYNPDFLHNSVPGVLTQYDLADVMGTIAPRPILVIGNMHHNNNQSLIDEELDYVRKVYRNDKTVGQFIVIPETEKTDSIFNQNWPFK
ncbi:alpha/beta hydrolase family protein [Mariniphaga sediminis]|uniref:alpha/beta hydrolase family protein n=1 Tax=Mariniphaga sediminis TaxID=1628158 RepID=UPI0035662B2D